MIYLDSLRQAACVVTPHYSWYYNTSQNWSFRTSTFAPASAERHYQPLKVFTSGRENLMTARFTLPQFLCYWHWQPANIPHIRIQHVF